MPMAAAQHGATGLLGGIGQARIQMIDGLLNARPGEYLVMSPADMQQVSLARSAMVAAAQANTSLAQQLRNLQNAAPVYPEAKNRGGETFVQWKKRCAARQSLAEVSGYPISDIELSVIDAERYEWEQINGK